MPPKKDPAMTNRAIKQKYADVPEDTATGFIKSKVFDDDVFHSSSHYTIDKLDSLPKSLIAKAFLDSITSSTVSESDPYRALLLASHLESVKKSSTATLVFDQSFRIVSLAGINLPYSTAVLQSTGENSKGGSEGADEEDELFDGEDANKDKGSGGEKGETSTPSEKVEVGPEVDVCLASFIAAYLLRLIVKSTDAVPKAWDSVMKAYMSFYRKKISNMIRCPSAPWLAEFKLLLTADPVIATTWLKVFVSKEHQEAGNEGDDIGMVRLLAILPLSYSGMHAYKLFDEVKRASNLSNQHLLTEMTYPPVAPGLECIALILTRYETTRTTSKTPFFKYARIIGPQYFQDIQTKSCPSLVYLLICLLQQYKSLTGNQDPERIVGIDKVTAQTKLELKAIAATIHAGSAINKEEFYSASVRTALKKVAEREESESDSDGEDDLFTGRA